MPSWVDIMIRYLSETLEDNYTSDKMKKRTRLFCIGYFLMISLFIVYVKSVRMCQSQLR